MSSVKSNEPTFLSTDYLEVLGPDGFIMMVVGVFLIMILIVCTIALIVWYSCKGKEAEKKNKDYFDDIYEPQLGVKVQPDHSVVHRPRMSQGLPPALSYPVSQEQSPKSEMTDVNGASGSDSGGRPPRREELGYSSYDDGSTTAM